MEKKLILKTVYATGDLLAAPGRFYTTIGELTHVDEAVALPSGRTSGGGMIAEASGSVVDPYLTSGPYQTSGLCLPRVDVISGNIVGVGVYWLASGGLNPSADNLSGMAITILAQGY